MRTSRQSGDHAPVLRSKGAAIADAHAMIDARKDEWTRLLQDLIKIPSCFEAEHDVVRYVCKYISAAGLAPMLVPMDAGQLRRLVDSAPPFSEIPGRNNIVVRVPGRGGGRSLILNSHLDIQPAGDPAGWTHPPFAAHVDAKTNTIYGRGAMDDKAGVAICLALIRVIVEQNLTFAGDLLFQFVLEDEVTGNGSLVCLEAGHTADAAIILDGTRPDRAIDRHAGNMEFHIAAKGQPASVSVSHLGANAAEQLSRTLLHLRDAFSRLNDTRQAPWTDFPSPFQFVVHGMAADAPRFCLPVEASARCFVTFPPPATIEGIRALLREEADCHAKSNNYPHPPVFCWDGFATEPVSCASDELRSLVSETAARNGIRDVRIGPSTGTSDLRHFAKRGIPCLLYGPGRGFNPHRADERFILDDVPAMMKLYLAMIIEWCIIT
jgi:acetylornithine deacetylase